MEPDKTMSQKKPYHKPMTKLLDPQETMASIRAAAQLGDKNAQAILNRLSEIKRKLK